MAIQVEDHSIEHASFEGELGEGSVEIWDRGTYEQGGRVPWPEALERGHAVFVLHGERLSGGFALQRTRRGDKPQWLLIKRADEHARRGINWEWRGAGTLPSGRRALRAARHRRDEYGVRMGRQKTRALALLASLAAVLLLVAGCGDDGDDLETLNLVSDPEEEAFEVVDLGRQGRSVGDIYVFDGPMLDPDSDEVVGHAYGTQTSLSLDDGAEVVQAMITYDLGEGNQILVGGTAEYPTDGGGLVEGEEYVRPILGGTGDYAAAGGTLTTVRQSDGGYEQTFEFGDQE